MTQLNLMSRIIFTFLFIVGTAFADIHYVSTTGTDSGTCTEGSPCLTIQYGLSQMAGGDTLSIADGTYSGTDNMITTANTPPVGSESVYTKVVAENSGGVIIDGGGSNQPFWYEPGSANNVYWEFDGLIFQNSSAQNAYLVRASYVKFFNCGFAEANDTSDSFYAHTCSYVLTEGCYSWGSARYHFHYYNTDYSIFRRCVVRHDRSSNGFQMGYQIYNSSYIYIQNCIFIDSDQDSYYNSPEQYFAYKVPQVSRGHIYFTGNIALNSSASVLFIQEGDNNTVLDMVGWDLANGIWHRGTGGLSLTSSTFGSLTGYGIKSDAATDTVQDNLFYNVDGIVIHDAGTTLTNDYNSLYLGGTDYSGATAGENSFCADNSNAIDPADGTPGSGTASLKYPVRIESGSDLDGAASDSDDIGATILKKIGTDGTLYGETGYATVTNNDLWPFPNEDLIRTKMAAYEYDDGGGGAPEITGDRGFCASGETLTKYIWEYLGNTIPCSIYNECGNLHGAVISGGICQ